MKTLEQLRADLQKHLGALEDFQKGIVADDGSERDYTPEEVTKLDELVDAVEAATKAVKAKERADRALAERAVPADGKEGRVPAEPKDEKRFKSFGEFLTAVAADGMNKGDLSARDPRLIYQKVAGANEGVPSEGGFLVQTDHSTALLDLMHDTGEIIGRTRRLPLSGGANSITLPRVDETSRQRGSRFGGVRAYWTEEGGTVTESKPKLDAMTMKLNKLMAIGYATEELLQDAALMESIMNQAFAEEMAFEVEDAIVNGTGAGRPLGFLNSGALVTVAKESGQAADTVVAQNVLKMWDALPVRSRSNAVWLVADSQIEPQLLTMTLPNSNANIYRLPGQNPATPSAEAYGLLLGRPVIPVEYMAALGDLGDMALVDLSQYAMIDKGGMAANQSMHVRFLYDEMAFRVTYRVDGQPAWKTPVTTANGASTKSPFVTLAARG